jgi:hypothetical protein
LLKSAFPNLGNGARNIAKQLLDATAFRKNLSLGYRRREKPTATKKIAEKPTLARANPESLIATLYNAKVRA